jgi:hypothetical protein
MNGGSHLLAGAPVADMGLTPLTAARLSLRRRTVALPLAGGGPAATGAAGRLAATRSPVDGAVVVGDPVGDCTGVSTAAGAGAGGTAAASGAGAGMAVGAQLLLAVACTPRNAKEGWTARGQLRW